MKFDIPKTQPGSKSCLGKLLLLSILFATLVLIANKTYLRLLIQGHLDYARAQGYPTTMAELYAFYEYPTPGENAAVLYLEAFEYFVEWDEPNRNLLPLIGDVKIPTGQYMDEQTLQLVSQYLDDNHNALILLHRAAVFPQCRYSVETEVSYIQANDHLGDIRHGNRLLTLESIYYANVQRLDLAAQTLIDSFALAHSLRQEPFLTSLLTRTGCDALNISILKDMLNLTDLPKIYLAHLQEALTKVNYDYELKRVMIGEYVEALNWEIYWSGTNTEKGFWYDWLHYKDVASYYRAQVLCLNSVRNCLKTLTLPYPDRILTVFSQEDYLEYVSDTDSLFDIVIYTSEKVLNSSFSINSQHEASRREAISALAVEQYRHDHNKLPDSLNELVPGYLKAVVKDPYDDQDLRYKKLEKGYVVYSVGSDRMDNDGRKENADGMRYVPGTDITFTVRR